MVDRRDIGAGLRRQYRKRLANGQGRRDAASLAAPLDPVAGRGRSSGDDASGAAGSRPIKKFAPSERGKFLGDESAAWKADCVATVRFQESVLNGGRQAESSPAPRNAGGQPMDV